MESPAGSGEKEASEGVSQPHCGMRAPQSQLLGAEGLDGVEARGAPSGQEAGHDGHASQEHGNARENGCVQRLNVIEQATNHPGSSGAGGEAQEKPHAGRTNAIPKHSAENFAALRAERDADADFGGALSDDVGKHAEQTDSGQNQRQDGEGKNQCGVETGIERRFADELVHCEDVGDGQVRVEPLDDLLNGQSQGGHIAT